MSDLFDLLDVDGGGQLTQSEFVEGGRSRVEKTWLPLFFFFFPVLSFWFTLSLVQQLQKLS